MPGGPISLVLDGHPSHRAKIVTRLVESTEAGYGCSSCPGIHRSWLPARSWTEAIFQRSMVLVGPL